MLPSRPFPRVPTFLPEVLIFRDKLNAVFGGQGVSMETLAAVDRFVRTCYNADVWPKLTEVYPFVGNSVATSATKLKWVDTDLLTLNNFVSGDYAERGASGGLLGNGS